jgi:hypothetical protein
MTGTVSVQPNAHILLLVAAFRDKEKALESAMLKARPVVGLKLRVECNYESVYDKISESSQRDLAQV